MDNKIYVFDEWEQESIFCSNNESSDSVLLMKRWCEYIKDYEYATIIRFNIDSEFRYEFGHYNMTRDGAVDDFISRTIRMFGRSECVYVLTSYLRDDMYSEYEHRVVGVYKSKEMAQKEMDKEWSDCDYYYPDADNDDVVVEMKEDEFIAHCDKTSDYTFEHILKIEKHYI